MTARVRGVVSFRPSELDPPREPESGLLDGVTLPCPAGTLLQEGLVEKPVGPTHVAPVPPVPALTPLRILINTENRDREMAIGSPSAASDLFGQITSGLQASFSIDYMNRLD